MRSKGGGGKQRHGILWICLVATAAFSLYATFLANKTTHLAYHVSYDGQLLDHNMIYTSAMGARLIAESQEFFAALVPDETARRAWHAFGRGKIDLREQTERALVNQTNHLAAAILTRPYPPLPAYERPRVAINCRNPIYTHALTGRRDAQHKIIIDLALFGYDVDLLELRLLEYGDLVHQVVVPEQNLNFKGVTKPYLIPTLVEGRLAPFSHMIDHHAQDVLELQRVVQENAMRQDNPDAYEITWKIPTAMRVQALRYIQQRYGPLDQNRSQAVYVIQNDGDEMIERDAMAHFGACELRAPATKVFFPGVAYKRNAAWLMETKDYRKRNRLPLNGPQRHYKALRKFVWQLGPVVQRLRDRTEEGLRAWPRPRPPKGERSMGIGASNHLSNPAHPILDFMKHISTVDAQPAPGDALFWQKATSNQLTYVDMRNLTFYCENLDTTGEFHYNPHWVHAQSIGPKLSDFLIGQLPWAALQMPERYPWLYRPDLFPMEQALYDCFCWNKCAPALETTSSAAHTSEPG
jgi:hypothetical protein